MPITHENPSSLTKMSSIKQILIPEKSKIMGNNRARNFTNIVQHNGMRRAGNSLHCKPEPFG